MCAHEPISTRVVNKVSVNVSKAFSLTGAVLSGKEEAGGTQNRSVGKTATRVKKNLALHVHLCLTPISSSAIRNQKSTFLSKYSFSANSAALYISLSSSAFTSWLWHRQPHLLSSLESSIHHLPRVPPLQPTFHNRLSSIDSSKDPTNKSHN